MNDGELRHSTVSSLRWVATAKVVGQLANWAITLIVIRLLSPGDYGLLAMANVVIGFLAMMSEMGFGSSLVQSPDWSRDRAAQVLGVALLVNAAFCIALLLGAPLVGAFFDEPRVPAVIRVAALQFVISAIALIPDAELRRSMRFKQLSIIEVTSGILGNLLTLGLAYTGNGVWALVFGGLLAGALRTFLLHVWQGPLVLPSFAFAGARRHIWFGARLTVTRILWYVFLQSDMVVAGKLLGKEALGIYSVAVHLASLPMQRASAIVTDVSFSAFSRIQSDRNAVATNLLMAIRLVSILAFPALWGLASIAPEFVDLVMGSRWSAVVVPLQIVAIAVPLRMIGVVISTATLSIGRVDIALLTTAVGTAIAPLAFWFAAGFGTVGLSVAWAAITPMMLILNVCRAASSLGASLRRVFGESVRSALAALGMAAAVLWLGPLLGEIGVGYRLLAEVLCGATVYVAATMLINRSAAYEAVKLVFGRRARPA